MTLVDGIRSALADARVDVDAGFGPPTIDVSPASWVAALGAARSNGAEFFDLLTAYDLGDDGFAVLAHVATVDAAEHVLVRTRVPREAATLATATGVYAGAGWHERETHEMFGIAFEGNTDLAPLLLSAGAPTTPLRKDTVLVARAARPWPGEKDPADSVGRGRRRVLPAGVPESWPAPGAGGQDDTPSPGSASPGSASPGSAVPGAEQ
jgi:NADH-quinone oxidoreductase subunit C